MTGTAGQKRVPSSFLEEYTVPVPPLRVQEEIVRLLRGAERLKELRQQASQLTSKIIQSVFLRMFGDPSTNPLEFSESSLGNLATMARYGPRFHNQPYSETGTPILRTTDITAEGEWSLNKAPKLKVSSADLERYKLRRGDVVISRSGSLGRCAVFDVDRVDCIPGAFLLHFRFGGRVLPEYIKHFILFPSIQKKIQKMGQYVAQPNVNVGELNSFKVPVPPIDAQKRFVETNKKWGQLRQDQKESALQINQLFYSLMDKSFRGNVAA
jgi:type I restriction enzyme S subunit